MVDITPRPHHDIVKLDKIVATKRAEVALLHATAIFHTDVYLPQAQINLVVENCFIDIANKKIDGRYIAAVIEGVGMRACAAGRRDDEVKRGVEQLLALASRSIKGERWASACEDEYYSSGCGVSSAIHQLFVDTIEEMVDYSLINPQPPTWSLDHRATFSLEKLIAAFDVYRPLQILIKSTVADRDGELQGQLEEMWCTSPWDEYGETRLDGCGCWDKVWMAPVYGHLEGCWGYDADVVHQ